MNREHRFLKLKALFLTSAIMLLVGATRAQVVVNGSVYGGGALANTGGATVTIKGGTVQNDVYGGGLGQLASGETTPAIEALVAGPVQVSINGGTVNNVFGCNNLNGAPQSTVQVDINDGTINTNVYGGGNLAAYTANSPIVNIKGGTVKQNVFGGGNQAGVGKSDGSTTTIVNVTGGTVGSDGNGLYGIYGGCNAEGTVTGPIEVNVTSNLGSSDHKLKGIYGGGLGAPTQTTGNVTVTIDKPSGDKSTAPVIYGDVYGGSALGKVNQADADPANLTKVDFKDGVLHGTLYGGGMGDNDNEALVNGLTQVTVSSGSISDGIYGGCNVNGTAKGNIQVDLTNGTVGADGATADVFGGGYGNLTNTEGNVEVNVNGASVVIWGDVYGGSGFGNVNKDANNTTTVNIVNGTIKGSVYGGGLGDKESLGTGHYNYAALVKGKVYVKIGLESQVGDNASGPTIEGEIYGCNNLNGSPQDNVFVDIFHTKHNNDNKYPKDAEGNPTISMDDLNVTLETASDSTNYFKKFALAAVYGGGNQAAYTAAGKTAKVTVHECSDNTVRTIYGGGNAADATNVELFIEGGRFDRIFGGGNGYSKTGNHTEQYLPGTTTPDPNFNPGANISGTATTEIQGGLFRQIFGGSNQYGNVGSASLTISKDENCALLISESFGGANEADITGDVTTTLACSDIEIGTFYGGSNLANIIDGDVTLNVFGGHYSNVFGGSKGKTTKAANIKGDVTLNLYGGTMTNAFGGSDVNGNITGKITVNVLDYEGDCALEVANIYGGGNWTAYSPSNASALSPEVNIMHIKSGNNITGNVYGGGKGDADHDAVVTANPLVNIGYVSSMSDLIPDNYYTTTSLSADALKASVSGFVFGGGDYASVAGNTSVTIQNENSSVSSLFGGGNMASVGGATVEVKDGAVSTGVYGGCNTSGSVGGNIYTYVYDPSLGTLTKADDPTNYSGTIIVNIKNDLGEAGTPLVEGIYGGGKGSATDTQGDITVTIGGTALDPTIYADVYGGSALGKVNKDANNSTSVTLATGTINGNIYGGGMGQTSPTAIAAEVRGAVQMNINGGSVKGGTTGPGVYGGCNLNGTVNGAIAVNVNGGTIGTDDTHKANVHGGGYGQSTSTGGNVEVTVNGASAAVWGDVYGGSALGSINGTAANTTNHTYVTLSQGTIHGDLYGGGLGSSSVPAYVYSPVTVTVNGGTVDNVFGCNNIKGAPQSTVQVDINETTANTMTIGNVYGGGNQAAYGTAGNSYPVVNLTAGTVTTNVFGGGLGETAKVTGNPIVNIQGGAVSGKVFGGGSAAPVEGNPTVNAYYGTAPTIHGGGLGSTANVTGNPGVVYNQTSGKTLTVTSAFGGGDAAGVTGNTDVQLKAGSLTNAFGGGNVADITGETNVTLEGATVANIYGGGNEANVSGTSTVTVSSGNATGGVYGGCNTKGSVGAVTVDLNGGKVGIDATHRADVYGGGYGGYVGTENPGTSTTGNVTVTLTGTTVYGDIYGGSAFGSVNSASTDLTTVNIQGDKLYGTVYGGGKGQKSPSSYSATSKGKTIVNFETANSNLTGIYGGANTKGNVEGEIEVNIKANVGADGAPIDIFGGGYGDATGTKGDVTVNIGLQDGSITPVIYGDIYGGSALGQVNDAASDKTTVNFLNGTLKRATVNNVVHGNIYGGGLGENGSTTKGQVNGEVVVNISNTSQTADQCKIDLREASIFGCNNTSGSPQSDVTVNVYKTAYNFSDYPTGNKYIAQETGTDYAIDQVFGGGNLADYTATTGHKATVNIIGCNNTIRRVFGGGNAADATGVANVVDGGRFDYIFGGGNGEDAAASIYAGGTNLTVHGGYINHLFGGSNKSGTISGPMEVSVDNTGCGENIHEFFGGSNEVTIGTSESHINLSTTIACGTNFGDVYGGSNLADIYGDVTLTINGGTISNVYAGSKGTSETAANINGDVTLHIYGGQIGNAFGGSNIKGNITGAIKVDLDWTQSDCSQKRIYNIYGGSNLAEYNPTSSGDSPEVHIKHGTVSKNGTSEGNVFGGGYGSSAKVIGSNPKVIVGDADTQPYAIVSGDVFGGGDLAEVNNGGTTLLLQGAHSSVSNFFGGGNKALVSGATSVSIEGGTITQNAYGGGNEAKVGSTVVSMSGGSAVNVFGGGNKEGVNNTAQVSISDNGTISTGLYGGCNTSGTVQGKITVNADGGTVGTSNSARAYGLFGGGFGNSTATGGDIDVILNGTTVYGDVYGGSAEGNVNEGTSNLTKVWMKTGTVNGNIYGGGFGDNNQNALVDGNVLVQIDNGTVNVVNNTVGGGNVFGCNNKMGAPQGTVQVDYNGGTVNNVYGGGNLAPYTYDGDYPQVNINNGTVSGSVFGGGLGSSATVTADPKVTIGDDTGTHKAIVTGNVYGGGDQAAVTGNTSVTYDDNNSSSQVTKLFGGGNQAGVSGTATVTLTSDNVGNVTEGLYGGCNDSGKIGGAITIDVNGGTAQTVFGGGYGSATETGDNVTVTIDGGTVTTDVYGGSALGQVNDNASEITKVELKSGTVSGNIYGGGLGDDDHDTYGQVNGNTQVVVSGGSADYVYGCNNTNGTPKGTVSVEISAGEITHDVFGGGNKAAYTGSPVVTIKGTGKVNRDVFGGGNQAVVNGNTLVKLQGGATINGEVYGGGNAGQVNGSSEVKIEE